MHDLVPDRIHHKFGVAFHAELAKNARSAGTYRFDADEHLFSDVSQGDALGNH